MSLSWRKRLVISLAPDRVIVVRQAGLLRAHLTGKMEARCEPVAGAPAWRAAVSAMQSMLRRGELRRAPSTVVLSNRFVRYLLVAPNAALAGDKEEEALIRARFRHTYGEAAKDWCIRLCAWGPGEPIVAAGIELGLLDAIQAAFAESGLPLRSVQPALMFACNRHGQSAAGNAWIALADADRIVLGLQRRGRWLSLRARPLEDDTQLAELIRQEFLLLGVEPQNEEIYLQASNGTRLQSTGLKVRHWPAPEAVGTAA